MLLEAPSNEEFRQFARKLAAESRELISHSLGRGQWRGGARAPQAIQMAKKGDYALLDYLVRLCLRWLRQAGAILLCALSFFHGSETGARENPIFMVEPEGKSLRVRIVEYILGDDLESEIKHRLPNFNLLQFMHPQDCRCNAKSALRLTGLDCVVNKPGTFRQRQGTAPRGCLNGCGYFSNDCNSLAAVPVAELNMRFRLELVGFAEFRRAYDDKWKISCEKTLFCDVGGFLSCFSSGVRNSNRGLHVARLAEGGNKQANGSQNLSDGCAKEPLGEKCKLPGVPDSIGIRLFLLPFRLRYSLAFFCFFSSLVISLWDWCNFYNERRLFGASLVFVAFCLGNCGFWLLYPHLLGAPLP
jgi:hypothetical protein